MNLNLFLDELKKLNINTNEKKLKKLNKYIKLLIE